MPRYLRLGREERIARARQLVREYAEADGETVATPRRRSISGPPPAGPIVSYLLATGWSRSPAEVVEECGAETEISICSHPARWSKGGVHLCAQHAAAAERIDRRSAPVDPSDYDDQGRPYGDVRQPETEEV